MDLISQNKELIGCPKMLERVAGMFWLKSREWLVINLKSRGSWLADLKVEGCYIMLLLPLL